MAGGITPSEAIENLKKSKLHNDVMLNLGQWINASWHSVGAALLRGAGLAPLWFAEENDDSVC